jgi:hypothetical protein
VKQKRVSIETPLSSVSKEINPFTGDYWGVSEKSRGFLNNL